MKTINEIADEIEQQAAGRMHEGETLMKLAQSLRGFNPLVNSVEPKLKTEKPSTIIYPGYNIDEADLLPKIRSIEEKHGTIWSRVEFENIVKGIEGKRAKKTFSNLNNKLARMVAAKQLFKIMLNGSVRYTYYFSNKDWLDKVVNGDNIQVKIKDQNFNNPNIIKLGEEFRSQNNMVWDQLNNPAAQNNNI